MKKKIVFIINPISGIHHSENIETMIQTYMDHDKFDVECIYTQYKGHGAEIAKAAVERKVEVVVAVGGDGTINEVASQLVNTPTIFAIIPHGSGNGLAYHLNLPIRNIKKIIRYINDLYVEAIDTCLVNGKPFFSIAGIGFDAKVAFDFNQDGHRGFVNYVKHIVANYLDYQSGNYVLTSNMQQVKEYAFFITFANSSQWGYNVKIAPMASMQDGKLDICICKRPHFMKMMAVDIPMLLSNQFNHSSLIKYIQTERMTIESEKGSDMYLHIDGDAVGLVKRVELEVLPSSLKIVLPSHS